MKGYYYCDRLRKHKFIKSNVFKNQRHICSLPYFWKESCLHTKNYHRIPDLSLGTQPKWRPFMKQCWCTNRWIRYNLFFVPSFSTSCMSRRNSPWRLCWGWVHPMKIFIAWLCSANWTFSSSVEAKMKRNLFGKVREDLFENIPSDWLMHMI